jgi:hypothetical protein
MCTMSTSHIVLDALARKPSRSSATTIGHRFLLDGSAPALRIKAIDALSRMVCDWSIVILEEAVCDPTRGYLCRQYALSKICGLLEQAVACGYDRIGRAERRQLRREAAAAIEASTGAEKPVEIAALESLSCHLCQAIADGVLKQTPDF